MAATSSLVSTPKKGSCVSKVCKACGLYLNQDAIYDEQKQSDVFWVGLSAVLFDADEEKLPLASSTASGALIHEIEGPFRNQLSFYKTNLIKCVPLTGDRIRYPAQHEMEKCFPNFEDELQELKPRTVFLLGKQVASFVYEKLSIGKLEFGKDFAFNFVEKAGIRFVPVYHPSYVLVYKRKSLLQYTESIQRHFPVTQNSKMGCVTLASANQSFACQF